jgi:hypothetical protein
MPCHAAACEAEGGNIHMSPFQRFSFFVARRLPPMLLQQTWPLFIKGAAIIGGLSLFLPWIPGPVSITSTLTRWEGFLWGALLVAGGVLGLWGMLKDQWLVHTAGLVMIGAPLLVYGFAVMAYRGQGAFFNAFLLGTLGVGCYVRALGMYVTHTTAEMRVNGHHQGAEHEHAGEGGHGAYGHVDADHPAQRRHRLRFRRRVER